MSYAPQNPPLFLADHPVLDLLNTIAAPAGTPIDVLQNDEDVLYWLDKADMAPAQLPALKRGSLLREIRELREIVRPLVIKRKAGKRIDPAPINEYLHDVASYPRLVVDGLGFRVDRERTIRTSRQAVAPLAEAAAEFLATADFELVRPCEGKDCILWFYDRTKSHRRRWCSMQVCGNRHKVEAFRERLRS